MTARLAGLAVFVTGATLALTSGPTIDGRDLLGALVMGVGALLGIGLETGGETGGEQ